MSQAVGGPGLKNLGPCHLYFDAFQLYALTSHPLKKVRLPVSSEISDFTSCTHAQSNILLTKYVDKTDY